MQRHHDNAIRCLIIDDDQFVRELLKDKLNQFFSEINVVGLAECGADGLERINSLKPDLVFLDVEMNDMTGFQMLSRLEEIDFKIIFITSYKHYAIKAIRFNALDYLLKPFDLEELKNAVHRFKKNRTQGNIQIALKNLRSKETSDQTLILNTQQGELHLQLKDIIQIKGDRNYSNIYLTNNRKELISKNLSQLEELLDEKGFFRCHKSHLINRYHIKLRKRIELIMTNDDVVPISRRKIKLFDPWYDQRINANNQSVDA